LPVDATLKGAKSLTEAEKREVIKRAQTVVNEVQIRELSKVLDLLADVLDDPKQRYFVVIDRLDEGWVEDELRYRLIRALIETAKDFHKVPNAKIVVALRMDLIDRVFQATRDTGFQEEKYESDFLPIKWNRDQLIEVLNRRIDHLIRHRYTNCTVTYEDVLPKRIGKTPTVDYMLQRTMMRPRDLIMFFNAAIAQAVDRAEIGVQMLRDAEGEYSRGRLRSLADEWRSDYPNLLECVELLKKRPPVFKADEITDAEIEERALEAASDGFKTADLISISMERLVDGKMSTATFRAEMIEMLYRVGIVGVKLGTGSRLTWSTEGRRTISSAELGDDVRIAVHPVFYRVLGIDSKAEGPVEV
jgi:hypothetical protein